jgi:hypothetical protein
MKKRQQDVLDLVSNLPFFMYNEKRLFCFKSKCGSV